MMHRFRRDSRGQSLVEMALVLPLLLALVVAIFEFGRAWNIRQVMVNAAREGARLAILPDSCNDEQDVIDAVEARMDDANLPTGDYTITVTGVNAADCSTRSGTQANVRIDYTHTLLFLGPVVQLMTGDGSGHGGDITLVSETTMRNE